MTIGAEAMQPNNRRPWSIAGIDLYAREAFYRICCGHRFGLELSAVILGATAFLAVAVCCYCSVIVSRGDIGARVTDLLLGVVADAWCLCSAGLWTKGSVIPPG